MKKVILMLVLAVMLLCTFAVSVCADDTAQDSYVESENAYTIYTDAQYQEVILGVYNGTLENKTIVLGCDISVTLDLAMEKPCDITIDLNGKTYTNNYRPVKWGDFDLRHKDAVIRIKNGNMVSNFCVFVFQTNSNTEYADVDNMGQVYLENVNIDSQEEIIYQYGGYGGVLSFKNCNMNVMGNYSTNGAGSCGTGSGMLYQIDGGTFDGFNLHCAKTGSYMRNCTVYDRQLFVDSWHSHGEESNNMDVTVELHNVIVNTSIKLNDARVDPVLYDCTFTEVDLTRGDQLLVAYTTANCTRAATKTEYKGSDTGVLDEQYSNDNPAMGHLLDMSNVADVKYVSYLENGAYVSNCTRCEAVNVVEKTGTAPALFTCLGFAVYENGTGGLVIAFVVNRDAVASYESVTGKTVEYGLFAVSQSKLGAGDVFDNEGNALSSAVVSRATSLELGELEIKIMGFTDVSKDKMLAIGAYVKVTDGEETVYSYIQGGVPNDGERYHFISYNEALLLC